MDISVIVPLFNEEESLPELEAWIRKVMKAHHYSYEIIMVDDGSKDASWSIVEDLAKNKGTFILATASDAPLEVAPVTAPGTVVQAVFDVAQSGDFASLEALCDPLGENDGDTQMICDLATDDTNRAEFVQLFATGRVSGDARISPEGDKAEVPFLFGPDGDRAETMELVNRDGQWYLFGF